MTSASAQSGHFHWVLAEFNELEDFTKASNSSRHAEGNLPFLSSMCFFGQPLPGSPKSKTKTKFSKLQIITERLNKPADIIDFSKAKSVSLLNLFFVLLSSPLTTLVFCFVQLDAQILVLENSLKITELGVRVRFLLARHLERSLETFFPKGCVLPFGSTVSGIGRLGGDLDLVLLPNKVSQMKFSQHILMQV